MSALATLGRMLGLTSEPDYDILHSERAARLVLSRRDLLLGASALTASRVMVPGSELLLPKATFAWDAAYKPYLLSAVAMAGLYYAATKP